MNGPCLFPANVILNISTKIFILTQSIGTHDKTNLGSRILAFSAIQYLSASENSGNEDKWSRVQNTKYLRIEKEILLNIH